MRLALWIGLGACQPRRRRRDRRLAAPGRPRGVAHGDHRPAACRRLFARRRRRLVLAVVVRRLAKSRCCPAEPGIVRFREHMTSGAVVMEVVEAVPPQRFVTRIADPDQPFGGTWTFEIAPDPAGSRLTITERGEVYNPIFRFMSRFIFGYTATMESFLRALRARLGADARSPRPLGSASREWPPRCARRDGGSLSLAGAAARLRLAGGRTQIADHDLRERSERPPARRSRAAIPPSVAKAPFPARERAPAPASPNARAPNGNRSQSRLVYSVDLWAEPSWASSSSACCSPFCGPAIRRSRSRCARRVEDASGQSVSRGAFYTTLDRLERKGLLRWTAVRGDDHRDGLPQRRFRVTAQGLRELKASRKTLLALWEGLEWTLGEN